MIQAFIAGERAEKGRESALAIIMSFPGRYWMMRLISKEIAQFGLDAGELRLGLELYE